MSAVIPDPATTDWVPLGGIGGGALVPIQEIALGANGDIDFQSIPQTYRHLKIIASLRGTAAAGAIYAGVRVNGAAGAAYNWASLLNATTTVIGAGAPGDTFARALYMPGSTAAAGKFGTGDVDFFDYANAVRHKSFQSTSGLADGTNSTAGVFTGGWASAAAINRIALIPDPVSAGGQWAAGSSATLYGIAPPGTTTLPPTGARVVRGSVSGAGAITAGSGFTAVKTTTGSYTITFATAFAAAPIVTVTLVSGSGGSPYIASVSATEVQIRTADLAAGLSDRAFTFHAIEP